MNITKINDEINANIQEFCNVGDKYSSKRVFTKAIEYYNKALLLVPEPKENYEATTWIYTAIGDSNYLSKNYAEALDNFNAAYKSYGGVSNPFILLRLGQCYHNLDNNKMQENIC